MSITGSEDALRLALLGSTSATAAIGLSQLQHPRTTITQLQRPTVIIEEPYDWPALRALRAIRSTGQTCAAPRRPRLPDAHAIGESAALSSLTRENVRLLVLHTPQGREGDAQNAELQLCCL